MHLFSKETYVSRRAQLREKVGSGLVLITGNIESPLNYKDNTYRFRQDSNFRYFFGINLPNLHAVLDCDTGKSIIFGDEYTMDDIIWVGAQESLSSLGEKVGVDTIKSRSELETILKNNISRLHYAPPYRHDNIILLAGILDRSPAEISSGYSEKLIKAIVNIRSYKTAEEIEQMHNAVNITRDMHLAAIRASKPDVYEYEVVAEIRRAHEKHNAPLAYPVIFSVNGQTLHNHYHGNKMQSGQLVLNDSGAENAYGYAGDITRTFPVDSTFSAQQKEIYEIVLKMEKDCIAALRPGVQYREIHIQSNRIMLEGLAALGIVSGNIEDMLAAGVGGMFMPHGLGHMIGMDVHDMEDLGEQSVGYRDGLERSKQLGLKSLRLARELEEGFVITVEPGLYFIPELIDKMQAEGKWKDYVHYDRLSAYKDFGGVRIEDDVLVTADGPEILGEYIPKEISEIESLRK